MVFFDKDKLRVKSLGKSKETADIINERSITLL